MDGEGGIAHEAFLYGNNADCAMTDEAGVSFSFSVSYKKERGIITMFLFFFYALPCDRPNVKAKLNP